MLMFKVDFVMGKHSDSVCWSKVWNLLGITSRVWPAASCQVPCVGGCFLLVLQSAIPDIDGVTLCIPNLLLAREAHDTSAQRIFRQGSRHTRGGTKDTCGNGCGGETDGDSIMGKNCTLLGDCISSRSHVRAEEQ